MKQNPMFSLVELRKKGIPAGIPSYCTASPLAIEGVLKQAQRFEDAVLIEATSNQVNQFGGYTGMKPADYRDFVYGIADKLGFDKSKIILAGDHLGPQPFQNQNADEAMANAEEMVRQYALAGYTKIHLDTSMRVADDDRNVRLSDEIIAKRGARLVKAAEEAWQELHRQNPEAMHPVFIIGSEVPIPGGAQVQETMKVTSAEDFEATLAAYEKVWAEYGVADLLKYVIAVVVQPGVEFGDDDIHVYDHNEASNLCASLKRHQNVIFEGHSTDYQPAEALRSMVQDGIGILKVGPALTFAAREALFALAHIEEEVVSDKSMRSDLIAVIEKVMVENPGNWKKYYRGTDTQIALKRAYSYSDRSRYYMGDPKIVAAIDKLFANLSGAEIPMGLLHQYMPIQYKEVRDGRLQLSPKELVLDAVRVACDDYNYATRL